MSSRIGPGLNRLPLYLGMPLSGSPLSIDREQKLKGLPPRQAGNPHEGRAIEQVSVWKQAPTLGEGDEMDPV
jgi:hypothetical protein